MLIPKMHAASDELQFPSEPRMWYYDNMISIIIVVNTVLIQHDQLCVLVKIPPPSPPPHQDYPIKIIPHLKKLKGHLYIYSELLVVQQYE